MRAHGVHAQPVQVVDRRPQPDDLGDRLGAGLELPRQVVVGRALDADGLDHVAARLEGVHGLEQLAPAVEDPGAGRAEHLVAAEGVEVAAQRAHVNRLMGRALGAVDQHGGPGLLRGGHHLSCGVDGAERVADEVERDQLGPLPQQVRELVLEQLSLAVDVDVLDAGAVGGGEDLPGDDVRVVVDDREHDQVVLLDVLATPRVGDEVDRLGRASRVDDLLGRGGVDERADLLARGLVADGRLFGDAVGGAMDVGVELFEVLQHRAGHLLRSLRGVGRVEVGQPRLEDREVLADRGYVEGLDCHAVSPGPRRRRPGPRPSPDRSGPG